MPRPRLLLVPRILLLASSLLAPRAAPAQGGWSPDTAPPGLGGRVLALLEHQGTLHAGGHTFHARGGTIGCLAAWDGAAWREVGGGVDLLGGIQPGAGPEVLAMCGYQGDLIVAGTFDRAGTVAANNIARWNGTSWQPLGQGLQETGQDARVRAVAVFQNELFAAGDFDVAGGQPANGIARWNGSAWVAFGAGLASTVSASPAGEALRVVGSELVLGGDFTSVAGVPCNHVARWNGSTWAPLGAGLDATVRALEVWSGQLVAGGTFSFSGSTFVPAIARWNGGTWAPLGSNGPPLGVTALQAIGTTLYAGGGFVTPGSYVARFDGSTWSGFGGVSGVFGGTINTAVWALEQFAGGQLAIGGEFDRAGSPPSGATGVGSTGVVAFDGSAWRRLGGGDGADDVARGVVQLGADWIVFGPFDQIGGVTARGLARWDGEAFHHVVDCDGAVESAVVWNGELVISGTFTQLGGQPIAGIARRRANGTWTQLGPPMLADLAVHQGQLYTTGAGELRRWNGSGWVTAAAASGIGNTIHAHTDGDLYFTTVTSSSFRVYRFDGTTATQIGAANDSPQCLGSHGTDLVVGGRFSTIDGVPTNRLARWNGTAWSAFGAGVTGFSVDAVESLDGELWIGANGDPRGFLLRWDGSAWHAVPGGLDGLPLALFADPAVRSVRVFGLFHGAGGQPMWHHGEWRTQPRWRNRLHGLPGAGAVPLLRGAGTLQAGTPWAYTVHAAPSHLGVLGLGLARVDVPVLGGTLVPSPDALLLVAGDATGGSGVASAFPANVPAGLQVFAQAWLLDATGPQGFTATNALECIAP